MSSTLGKQSLITFKSMVVTIMAATLNLLNLLKSNNKYHVHRLKWLFKNFVFSLILATCYDFD